MLKHLRAGLAAALIGLAPAPALAADKLTVMLDWFVNPDHAPLYVALEKGYFRDAGLDVQLIAPADPNDPPKLVAAGRADVAISYQPELHLQVAEGLPLARIGTLVATPLNTVISLENGPIDSLKDLKGRKVGFSIGGSEDALLATMLESVGLSLKDVTMVNVNFSLSPALLAGQVDATIGGFRNFELNQMAIEGHPGRAFFPEEHGVPPYDELIYVANAGKLSDPRLNRFMTAVERGAHFLVNHPDESWQLFIKGRKELDTELNKRAWAATLPRFSQSPAALDEQRYIRFAEFLKARGLAKTVPALSTYAVQLKP